MALQYKEVRDDLISRAIMYITNVADNATNELLYHDLKYTFDRDIEIERIGKGVGLSYQELLELRVAALFIDIPYWVKRTSTSAAKDFLQGEKLDEALRNSVLEIVEFSSKNGDPKTLVEMILCDARNGLKTKRGFFQKISLLKKEEELRSGKQYTELEWYRYNEKLLSVVQFNTGFANQEYQRGLETIKKQLRKKSRKLQQRIDQLLETELKVDSDQLKELKKKLKKVEGRPDRGVETLFRLASGNHFTMNGMVDKKSSILISINSIILSIIIGTVLQELEKDPHLLVPVVMLSITNLWSIALAVFATRPESTHGESEGAKKISEGSNLLFYGNFHHMTEQEYLDGMEVLTQDSDKLYGSIASDVYYLGINLNHKFKLLRKSFNIFVYGFILSVVTFIVCHLFFGQNSLFGTT